MTKGDVKKMNQAEHALPTSKANVILHAFDWKYADIAKQAKKNSRAGLWLCARFSAVTQRQVTQVVAALPATGLPRD